MIHVVITNITTDEKGGFSMKEKKKSSVAILL